MADSVSYKCPNCGAPLSFLPVKKTVTCEYCGTVNRGRRFCAECGKPRP